MVRSELESGQEDEVAGAAVSDLPDEITEHYRLERQLADRLRSSSRAERLRLYSEVYDELYSQIPNHPSVLRKSAPGHADRLANSQLRFLGRFVGPETEFMEIGPGSCALSFAIAPLVKRVRGVDVSAEVTSRQDMPENFDLIISDGVTIPVPPESVDVAYSNQLMEHLHPEDALDQLGNIYRSLRPGGIYICITPNRLNGPHDISKYFDRTATGLHLQEYTATELCAMFRQIGFARTYPYVHVRKAFVRLPVPVVRGWEFAAETLMRYPRLPLGRLIYQVRVVGEKAGGTGLSGRRR